MWETPAVRPHEEPMVRMPADVVPVDGGEEVYRSTPTFLLTSPFEKGDPEAVRQGEKLYHTYCNQCHGPDHDGNGTVGQSFHPLPGDLKSRKVQTMQEGRLFKEISYGSPNGRRPPLATTIGIAARWRIISYIHSLDTRKGKIQ